MAQFEIDYQKLLKQMENDIVIKVLSQFANSKQEQKYIEDMLSVFVRHGVDAKTSIDIIVELAKLNGGTQNEH